jgi:hypothetical protein
MTRALTPRAYRSLRVGARDDQFLALMTIEHRALDPSIRICCDESPVTSRGFEFVGAPFNFSRMGDTESTSEIVVSVANVDRRISDGIMLLEDAARITIEVILRESPNEVIEQIKYLNLVNVRITSAMIEGTLIMDNLSREPWPSIFATKARFPGLWFR